MTVTAFIERLGDMHERIAMGMPLVRDGVYFQKKKRVGALCWWILRSQIRYSPKIA